MWTFAFACHFVFAVPRWGYHGHIFLCHVHLVIPLYDLLSHLPQGFEVMHRRLGDNPYGVLISDMFCDKHLK